MAAKDVEVELQEVRVDVHVPAADPVEPTRTQEEVLENLKKDVYSDDVESLNNHLEELERLLQGGDTVGERLADSGTLCYATWAGSITIMDILVQKGVDINTKSKVYGSEWTPLHVATFRANLDALRYLCDKGADGNIKDEGGNTPLHMAAKDGSHDAVRCLVEIGAKVYIENNSGETPIDRATESGIVKYLIDNAEDTEETVLKDIKDAIYACDMELFNQHLAKLEKVLQDDTAVRERLAASGTMCYAADVRSIPMMDILIEKGVDFNSKSSRMWLSGWHEWTPLHVASWHGYYDEVVRYLGDKGADVNAKDDRGWTPLVWAAKNGCDRAIRYLVDKGADISIRGENWNTPLHEVAEQGRSGLVEFLVEKGADVNVRNRCGSTPLHLATKNSHVEIQKYLADHGADVSMKDGEYVLKNIIKVIQEGDVESFHKLLAEVEEMIPNDDNNMVERLAVSGALCYAAKTGSIPMMDTLIQKGVDINTIGPIGPIGPKMINGLPRKVSPLHAASLGDTTDTMGYLIDKGADVNIKDESGQTCLLWACRDGMTEIVKYLLENGADPSITEPFDGHNSLSLAVRSRHEDVVEILLGSDKWKEMLRNPMRNAPVMRELIALMPDLAEVAFNRCVTTNEGEVDERRQKVQATTESFTVDYNYEFLEDFHVERSSDSGAESWHPNEIIKDNHPLNLIVKHGRSNLLKHPLVISLIDYKWTTFGRYIFFGNLFIYLVFLTFLTAFALVVLSPLERTCVNVTSGSFNRTAPEDCEGLSIHEYRFLYVGAAITILTALLRLATEIFQLCRQPLEYLLDWVNWLEIPLYLLSITFTFVFATPCLCVYSWQWQIGVVAVFLGWVGLITFLQKWPVTGVYVLMFVNILTSFLKIAFLALLLVIAFALAFYMLLFEPDETRTAFSHPGRAIVKVMAMTIGELDYDELYHQQEGEDEIAFPPVSFFLWIIFLVLMPVLLSNLLVGLAVGDVDHLQRSASENRIALQIDLVLSFEELLESLHLRHRFVIKQSKTFYPNVPATLLPQWCKRGATDKEFAEDAEFGKAQKRVAKWYSKLFITDEFSTSGRNISDAIKPQDSLEKQLQQLEAKLKKHSEKQSDHFQEAVRQLSEEQAKMAEEQVKKSEEQVKKMEEQTEHLAGEVASLREAVEKLVTQMTK